MSNSNAIQEGHTSVVLIVSRGTEQMGPCDIKQGQDNKEKWQKSRHLGKTQGIGLVGNWLREAIRALGEERVFSQTREC